MAGLTGAVLAGGHSSRFGSNKALFVNDGKPLIQHALDVLRPLCDSLFISASSDNAQAYSGMGANIVCDLHPDCGPVGGIEALADTCHTDRLLVLTCDMPFITTALLSRMTEQEDHEAVAWTLSDGSIMPFPLLLHRTTFRIIQRQVAQGNLRMKLLLKQLDCKLLPATDDKFFANINHPEDFSIG